MAFSPDGKRLASRQWPAWDATKRVYGAGEVKVWDVQTGRELLVLKHTGSMSVAYSPDGKRLASAGQKPVANLWPAPVRNRGRPRWSVR